MQSFASVNISHLHSPHEGKNMKTWLDIAKYVVPKATFRMFGKLPHSAESLIIICLDSGHNSCRGVEFFLCLASF